MLLADPLHQGGDGRLTQANLGSIVASLGTPQFTDELVRFLKEVSAVEHVHLFQMMGNKPHVLRAVSLDHSGDAERQADIYMSRRLFTIDPWVIDWLESASGNAALFHVPKDDLRSAEIRHYYDAARLADRLMVCGASDQGILGISLAKSQQSGSFDANARFDLVRDLALPLFAKHRDFCAQRTKLSRELLDVAEIESRMRSAPERLPQREIQVAARILRGLTASGIALDLGIGRETVICYRKRLYDKLGLASYHDLLSWYMNGIASEAGETIN